MKRTIIDWLTYIVIGAYTLAAVLVSLHRFWQFEVFYYDFGIFDSAIWKAAHFTPPIIDHFVIGGKVIFADHFSPSIFLLSPLYWFTDRPEALLIAQAIAVCGSALILYAIAKHYLTTRLSTLAVVVSYLLFVGLQNALIADIHEVTYMTLPLMGVFYAIVTKKKTLFWICFFITLGFKESSALLGVALGIFISLFNKTWKRTALLTAIVSVFWGVLTTQVIIPYFYGRPYFYTPHINPNPVRILMMFADDPVKRNTVLMSFLSFGFLPLLYPPAWILILQDLATRFLQNEFSLRWGLGLHYNAQMAVILAFASVMGLHTLEKKVKKRLFILSVSVFLMMTSVFLHRFLLRGPLGLSYNPAFYRNTKNFAFLNDLISRVPKGTSVMTMNNIAPHMVHTHDVFLLRGVYEDFMPEYFVLDLREGQNFNNFFGADIEAVKLTLPRDTRYEIYYQNGDQIIYKRK